MQSLARAKASTDHSEDILQVARSFVCCAEVGQLVVGLIRMGAISGGISASGAPRRKSPTPIARGLVDQ